MRLKASTLKVYHIKENKLKKKCVEKCSQNFGADAIVIPFHYKFHVIYTEDGCAFLRIMKGRSQV